MKTYIQKKNINVNFIEVLARRKELVNGGYLEPFGLGKLINETLNKCKNAFQGEMFSVITESMSQKIYKIIEEQNALDKDYIIRMMKMSFINNFGLYPDKEVFIRFIVHLLCYNIKIFFEKKEPKLSPNCELIFLNSSFINNYINTLIGEYERIANNLTQNLLDKRVKEFMDLQIDIQKECKGEISYKNLRNFKGFKETTEKFLLDNLHNIGQIKII